MAFGRLERSSGPQPMADINMTPLIDVMLVLLVIFMIAAPLMSASLRLQLPRSAAATPGDAPAVLRLTLTAEGRLLLGGQALDPAEPQAIDAALAAAARRQPGTEVQLRADQAVPYGRVAELIGRIQAAGLNRIAFVAEPRTGDAVGAVGAGGAVGPAQAADTPGTAASR